MGLVRRTLHLLHIDQHVGSTLVYRVWSVVAGLLVLVILPLKLGSVQLGYYYTFNSMLALQVFFELGMNQVISQIVAHESAHLKFDEASEAASGDQGGLSRLSSVAQLLDKWYLRVSVTFFLVVVSAGFLFLRRKGVLAYEDWVGPWVLVCLMTSVNLYLSPRFSVLEGLGRVGQVARARMQFSMAGYSAMVILLLAGAGLWAVVSVAAMAAAGAMLWGRQGFSLVRNLKTIPIQENSRIDWRRDVWSLQWKIALSWISGYLIFQLMTPLVFEHQGPEEAGRFGLILAALSAIQAIGMSWVYSKSPVMAAQIARGDRRELKHIFLQAFSRSLLVTTVGCGLLIGMLWAIRSHGYEISERFPSTEVAAWLSLVTLVNSVVFSLATFMRAHREEKLTIPSVVGALIVAPVLYFSSKHSLDTMAAFYCVTTSVIGVPWSLWHFRRYWVREV